MVDKMLRSPGKVPLITYRSQPNLLHL